MNMMEKKPKPSAEDRQVLDYLKTHPDFFKSHPEILETLYLPHPSGAAVSLVEKQLSVLRERNTELRTQLSSLVDQSKANDRLFGKSRKLVLELVGAKDRNSIVSILNKGLKQDFAIEFHSLTLLEPEPAIPGANSLSMDQAIQIGPILDSDMAVCGALRSQQLSALFGEDAKKIGSAVALRLAVKKQPYGVLALGNSDSHYYHNGMDTLFLRFLVDILNQLLHGKP